MSLDINGNDKHVDFFLFGALELETSSMLIQSLQCSGENLGWFLPVWTQNWEEPFCRLKSRDSCMWMTVESLQATAMSTGPHSGFLPQCSFKAKHLGHWMLGHQSCVFLINYSRHPTLLDAESFQRPSFHKKRALWLSMVKPSTSSTSLKVPPLLPSSGLAVWLRPLHLLSQESRNTEDTNQNHTLYP